ncbi:MAG: hypothetical protein A3H44_11530 [Gammaproteobacteria bacterium RIFCSPLOWO2_02_FULL_57_10]|nr:MAG: hypothetical protein A3H44_11530 [Gammaproteobacteria bacterium RIFCSPLOWO2_02_FULL_57_10]
MTKTNLTLFGSALLLLCMPLAAHADGRIKGTGGVSSISGAGGGGLTPWAVLTSHSTREEWGGSVFLTTANVDDFTLDVAGAGFNYKDRIEVSYARQNFTIKANDARISQDIVGLKYRLAGDLLYGTVPQIVIGAEHHSLRDPATARAVGARKTHGTDVYVSTARAWIDGIANRTTMLNVNLRYSTANQFGLLGHGGDDMGSRLHLEAAAGVFLTRSLVVGAEYRHKSDNLSALNEESATDVFVAWLPSKRFSVTAAWVDLGEIAGAADQTGFYLSIQGTL